MYPNDTITSSAAIFNHTVHFLYVYQTIKTLTLFCELQPNYPQWSSGWRGSVFFYLMSEVPDFPVRFLWGWWSVAIRPRLPHRRQHQKKNWLCLIKGALRTRCRPHSDNLLTPALKTTNGSLRLDRFPLVSKSIAQGGVFCCLPQFLTVLA